jgi:hypothetical protein
MASWQWQEQLAVVAYFVVVAVVAVVAVVVVREVMQPFVVAVAVAVDLPSFLRHPTTLQKPA